MRWNDVRNWRAFLLLPLLLLAACSGRTPQQSYEAGAEAYQNGRVREAKIALMNALQADPSLMAARLLQARIALDADDGIAAEAEVARARQNGATPADTNHLLAYAKLLQNDARKALELAGQAVPANRSYALRVQALAQLQLGDQVLAMRLFDQALAADPNNARAWLDVARFRRSIGDTGPAIFATDKAVAADPHLGDALVLRGELSRSQYGLAAAIPWFSRAIENDPGNLSALLARAATFGDMGRMQAMLADCRAAHALAPENPLPYLFEAVLAMRAGNFALARDLYAKTNAQFEALPAGLLIRGVLAYQSRDYETAVERFGRLVDMQPANAKARRLLASALLRKNDVPGAALALRSLADRPDADSYVLSLAAQVAQRQNDGARAQAYRDRAAVPQRTVPAAWGWSEYGNADVAAVGRMLVAGDKDGALARARDLETRWPGVADVWLLTGDVLVARGEQAEAAEHYRRAANLNFSEAAATRLIGALARAGKSQEADQVLRLYAAENPGSLTAQQLLAARALQGEQWEEAIERYEALRARIGNGDAALLNNLAWAYARGGDDDRAILFARRAWLLAPANPATAETLGWALRGRGDRAQGMALLLAARRGRPADALIRAQP